MAGCGGGEFVWLLPGANGKGALQAAERARSGLASASCFTDGGMPGFLTGLSCIRRV